METDKFLVIGVGSGWRLQHSTRQLYRQQNKAHAQPQAATEPNTIDDVNAIGSTPDKGGGDARKNRKPFDVSSYQHGRDKDEPVPFRADVFTSLETLLARDHVARHRLRQFKLVVEQWLDTFTLSKR